MYTMHSLGFKIFLFLSLVMVSMNSVPVSVQCGDSKGAMINVSYYGEAFAVYSTANEQDCIFQEDPTNPTIKTFQGINETNCGIQWDETLKVYTFSIRAQLDVVINDGDDVFGITCAYGSTARPQTSATITDPNFLTGPVSAPENVTDIQLTVLNEGDTSISEVEQGKSIKLHVNATGFTSGIVDVWSCSIIDSLNDEPGLKIRFLYESCGTGYMMDSSSGFTEFSTTELKSDVFQVTNTFYGPHYFLCSLKICSANCTQGCQMPFRPQSGAVRQIWVSAPINISEPPMTTTSTPATCQPEIITQMVVNTTTPDNLQVQIPYIISLSIVVLILLMMVVVVFLVYRGAAKYRRYNRTHHTPMNAAYIPSSCSACADENEAMRCFYHNLNYSIADSTWSSGSSPTSSKRRRSTRTLILNRRKKGYKPAFHFTPPKTSDDRNIFRFYLGKGFSYTKPVRYDPTKLSK